MVAMWLQATIYVMMHGGEVAHKARGYSRDRCCLGIPSVVE